MSFSNIFLRKCFFPLPESTRGKFENYPSCRKESITEGEKRLYQKVKCSMSTEQKAWSFFALNDTYETDPNYE